MVQASWVGDRPSVWRVRPLLAAEVAGLGLAVLFCLSWFFGTDRSSLWIDELFTTQVLLQGRDLAGALNLVFHDVHPPLYYLLLLGWTDVVGFSPGKIRLFSALCGVGAIAVLYFGSAASLGRWARTFLAAVAASSLIMFNYAQDARMYALIFLFEAILLVCALRCQAAYAEGRTDWPALWGAGAAALLASLTQFYGFLSAGLVLFWLLVFARGWRARAYVIAAGLAILAIEVPLALRMAANGQDIGQWFIGDGRWVFWQTRDFLISLLNPWNLVGFLAVAGLAGWGFLRGRRLEPPAAAPSPAPLALALWVVLGAFFVGAAVNLLLVPSFSSRNLHVTTPFVWLGVAYLAQYGVMRLPESSRGWAALVLTLCLFPSLLFLGWKGDELRTPWRESAQYVTSRPGCERATLTVVGQPEGDPAHPMSRWAYGYYAPRAQLDVVTAPRGDTGLVKARLAEKLGQTAAPGSCPVVLWSVQHLDGAALRGVVQALAADPRLPRDRRLVVRPFRNTNIMLNGRTTENTYVVELVPTGPTA